MESRRERQIGGPIPPFARAACRTFDAHRYLAVILRQTCAGTWPRMPPWRYRGEARHGRKARAGMPAIRRAL